MPQEETLAQLVAAVARQRWRQHAIFHAKKCCSKAVAATIATQLPVYLAPTCPVIATSASSHTDSLLLLCPPLPPAVILDKPCSRVGWVSTAPPDPYLASAASRACCYLSVPRHGMIVQEDTTQGRGQKRIIFKPIPIPTTAVQAYSCLFGSTTDWV